MKRKYLINISILYFIITLIIALPTMFLPKRWLDIQTGMAKPNVERVLGIPDCSMDEKQFSGWHNPFYLGASVLIIHYDEEDKVSDIKIETDWGWAYQNWESRYRHYLKPSLSGSLKP